MTNLHILGTIDFEEFGTEFEIELNGKRFTICANTIMQLVADGEATTVTYNIENEMAISENINLDYAEVATEEDGYDVYVHYFNMYDGEITRKTTSGRFFKTYKRLTSAEKYASTLAKVVVK